MQKSLSLDQLQAMGVNLVDCSAAMVRLGGSLTTDETNQIRDEVQNLRSYGMRAVSAVSAIRVYKDRLQASDPEGIGHVVKDAKGQPLLWQGRSNELVANLLDPYWRGRLKSGIDVLASAGVALVHVDNPHMLLSYDQATEQAWQGYATRVTQHADAAPSLAELAMGSPEAEQSEEQGGELTTNRHTDQSSWAALLKQFQYDTFMSLLREIHACARDVNPEVMFDCTGHVSDHSLYYWTFGAGALDVLCIENATASLWFEPEGESLIGLDLAYAASGGKPVWIVNQLMRRMKPTAGGETLDHLNPSPDREELYLASAICKGAMVDTQSLQPGEAHHLGKQSILYDQLVSDYYRMMKQHGRLFREQAKVTDVALVVSALSWVYDGTAKRSLYGLGEELLKSGRTFDLLVAEKMDAGDLNKYHTVIAADLTVLSDRNLAIFKDYTSAGGRLIISGKLGSRTPTFSVRSGAEQALSGRFVTQLRFRGSDLFQRFIDPTSRTAQRAELLAAVNAAGEGQLRCVGNRPPRLVTEIRSIPGGCAIHILNYNFNILPADAPEKTKLNEEKAISVENLKLEIRTPTQVMHAVAYTAGGKAEELRVVPAADGWVDVNAGTVKVYKVIELELEQRS
jgi:hypothetical protein